MPNGAIGKKSTLVEVMAGCMIGNKPLPEPQMNPLIDNF